MPTFDRVPLAEAKMKTASGKRAQLVAEYVTYIEQLQEGEAGRLRAGERETAATVRRRLGVAAKEAGKDLTIRRSGEDLYFWVEGTRRRKRTGSQTRAGGQS